MTGSTLRAPDCPGSLLTALSDPASRLLADGPASATATIGSLAQAVFGADWPEPLARYTGAPLTTCQRLKQAVGAGEDDVDGRAILTAYMTISAQHAQAAFKGLLGEEVAARWALYDRPVTDLELPRRALNVIRNEGWTKIGSIATASFNLAGIPNCGEKTKAEIEGELKRIGLGLYEPALGWQP